MNTIKSKYLKNLVKEVLSELESSHPEEEKREIQIARNILQILDENKWDLHPSTEDAHNQIKVLAEELLKIHGVK